jgi:hypothetical protein
MSLTASVTLAAPLYVGPGGVLDPDFWLDNVPAAGDTLQYDGTYLTIEPNGETVWTTNNATAAVQFDDGTGLATGTITITPDMVAYVADTSGGSATLTHPAPEVATDVYFDSTTVKFDSTTVFWDGTHGNSGPLSIDPLYIVTRPSRRTFTVSRNMAQ